MSRDPKLWHLCCSPPGAHPRHGVTHPSPGLSLHCLAPALTDGCSGNCCLQRGICEFLAGLFPGTWWSFTHTESQESLLGLEGKLQHPRHLQRAQGPGQGSSLGE